MLKPLSYPRLLCNCGTRCCLMSYTICAHNKTNILVLRLPRRLSVTMVDMGWIGDSLISDAEARLVTSLTRCLAAFPTLTPSILETLTTSTFVGRTVRNMGNYYFVLSTGGTMLERNFNFKIIFIVLFWLMAPLVCATS